jgi:hypothetical protein
MCSLPIPHISINITMPPKKLDIQTNIPIAPQTLDKMSQTDEEPKEDSECKFVRIKHL